MMVRKATSPRPAAQFIRLQKRRHESVMSALVSICIPTHDGALWIERSLRSALAQTYEPLEILVLDNASADRTLELVRSFRDPRIRVEVNERDIGMVRNLNRCVRLAKGSLVKFLMQDDLLYPMCVEKMAQLFEENQQLGMAFAPRDVLMENPEDPDAVAWKKQYGTLHTGFKFLSRMNRGRDLFNQLLACGFQENWIGEPSSVMLKKACLEQIGLFNTQMRQDVDLETWIRMMYFYDVGFVGQPLSVFRFHSASATSANRQKNLRWLDRMWLLEGLLRHEEIRRNNPKIKRLRWLEAANVLKCQVLRIYHRETMPILYMLKSFADYLNYRLLVPIHRAPTIHG